MEDTIILVEKNSFGMAKTCVSQTQKKPTNLQVESTETAGHYKLYSYRLAKILVTGGLGYIGSHTCVALFESGHEPVVIDNLSNSEAHVKNQIEAITNSSISLEVLDLCDFDALNRFLEKENDIAGVIHFAALKAVGESVERA